MPETDAIDFPKTDIRKETRTKTSIVTTIDMGGQTFRPCMLLEVLWAVRNMPCEIIGVSRRRLSALVTAGAIQAVADKGQTSLPGTRIDDIIEQLTDMVTSDPHLDRQWQDRHAMQHHPGNLKQRPPGARKTTPHH